MLNIVPSNQFKKDLKLAKKRGFKIEELITVIDILAKQQPLDAKYKDHYLTGDFQGFKECHIKPDWLLIHREEQENLKLFLFRTGTHSDLF